MTDEFAAEPIRRFILDRFLPGENPSTITAESPLLASGLLDSLAILELIGFIEEQFGVTLEAHDVSTDNFGTIHAMMLLVRRLQQGRT